MRETPPFLSPLFLPRMRCLRLLCSALWHQLLAAWRWQGEGTQNSRQAVSRRRYQGGEDEEEGEGGRGHTAKQSEIGILALTASSTAANTVLVGSDGAVRLWECSNGFVDNNNNSLFVQRSPSANFVIMVSGPSECHGSLLP